MAALDVWPMRTTKEFFALLRRHGGRANRWTVIHRGHKDMHAISFDIEDYNETVLRYYFGLDTRPSDAIVPITHALLEELARVKVLGTFFILGSIAKEYPGVVSAIAAAGHELALHGYRHQNCSQMSPKEFELDVSQCRDFVLRAAPNAEIRGYRAPRFSMTKSTPWVPEVLCKLGLEYQSSVFPAHAAHFGMPEAPRKPFRYPSGLIEVPLPTIKVLGRYWPVGGGGYLRLFPYWVNRWAMRQLQSKGMPIVTYMHPSEFDTTPLSRHSLSAMTRGHQPIRKDWKAYSTLQYINRSKSMWKLRKLLTDFDFCPVSELIESFRANMTTFDPLASGEFS